MSETRRDDFVRGLHFGGSFEIRNCGIEVLFIGEEIGALEQCGDVFGFICEHSIESRLGSGLIPTRTFGDCETDPRGCGRFRNRGCSFCEFECFLRVACTQTDFRKHAQSHGVFVIDSKRLAKHRLGLFVAILSHQQRAESGEGERPILFVRDSEAKGCFRFRKTAQRYERVAALELSFGEFGSYLERLLVKTESLFKLAACVCALSAFEQTHGIGCVVAKCFRLCKQGGWCTQAQQHKARRNQQSFLR